MNTRKLSDERILEVAETVFAQGDPVTVRSVAERLKELGDSPGSTSRLSTVVRKFNSELERVRSEAEQVIDDSGQPAAASVPQGVRLALMAVERAVIGEIACLQRAEARRSGRLAAQMEADLAAEQERMTAAVAAARDELDRKFDEVESGRVQLQEQAESDAVDRQAELDAQIAAAREEFDQDLAEREAEWDADRERWKSERKRWHAEKEALTSQALEIARVREEYERKLDALTERHETASRQANDLHSQLVEQLSDANRDRRAVEVRLKEMEARVATLSAEPSAHGPWKTATGNRKRPATAPSS